MTKKQLLEKLNGLIELDKLNEYLSRLQVTYTKNGTRKSFFYQYIQGDGTEMGKKFWSKHSSSRIAFDLYSHYALDPNYDDFEFEFHLPGIHYINSKSEEIEVGSPNMDVYYRKDDTVYFIESKFTEKPSKITDLAQAYYVLDPEYKSDRKTVSCPIEVRFHGRRDIAEKFKGICNKYLNKSDELKKDWFDYKQEICHLFGIVFYILENNEPSIKNIDFQNIVYQFDDMEISKNAKEFMEDAKNLVKDVVGEKVKFEYKISFIQDRYQEEKDKLAFGFSDGTKVKEIMQQYFVE